MQVLELTLLSSTVLLRESASATSYNHSWWYWYRYALLRRALLQTPPSLVVLQMQRSSNSRLTLTDTSLRGGSGKDTLTFTGAP